ncbi:glycosyltransferase [Bacteroides sp.]
MIDKDDDIIVSIRCLTYNHEPYIRQCLEGFVIQKTNFRFEAIVHDDASTDRTAAIIKEYAEKYPDIIKPIFETENQYSKHDGSLRRIMNEHTHGKYVAMCEGDDYWIDPLKLQKQVDFLEAHPDYSMCFHNAIIFYQHVLKDPHSFCIKMNISKDISLEEIVDDWIIPTASIVYRRNILPFPDWASKIYSGDMTLALWAYSKGKVFYTKDIMSFYRKTETGMSGLKKNSAEHVYSQRALLFTLFNTETKEQYSDVLSERIAFYDKLGRFWLYRKRGLWYAFLRMPIFFCRKIYLRLRRSFL